MNQLASLLGNGGGGAAAFQSDETIVECKAGRMNYDGKTVVADKRRGTLKVTKDQQGIRHLSWTEAGAANAFQNIMIFPGDAKFEKVKQSKDRVYILNFIQGNQRHFYWFQDKDEEEDAERCTKINNAINGTEGNGNIIPLF